MSNKIQRHADICKELNELTAAKDHDYGDSTHATFQKFGIISYLTRLYDKLNRASVLAKNGGDAKVTDEKLEDTLLDMANYCILAVDDLRQEKKTADTVPINLGDLGTTNPHNSSDSYDCIIIKYTGFCDNCQNANTKFCDECNRNTPLNSPIPSNCQLTAPIPSNYCPNN